MASVQVELTPRPLRGTSEASCLGQLVALEADGTLRARLDGPYDAPVVVRLAAPLGRRAVLDAIAQEQQAVFLRPQGSTEPVLLALLVPPHALASDQADVGVTREANRLVLRAGKATVALHDNGKVEIVGVRIVAQAQEDHRILGRTVRIN